MEVVVVRRGRGRPPHHESRPAPDSSSPVLVCFFVFLFLVSYSVFTIPDRRRIPLLRLLVRFFFLVSCSVSKRLVTVFASWKSAVVVVQFGRTAVGGGGGFLLFLCVPMLHVGVPVLPELVWW
jgi:hypothetical protein